jgi:hypothetical protein
MVVNTNIGCEDEYCCCPCHEKKDNTPLATPPLAMMSGFSGYYSYN